MRISKKTFLFRRKKRIKSCYKNDFIYFLVPLVKALRATSTKHNHETVSKMPLHKNFIKPPFRLSVIPKYKFWLGVSIGILQAVTVYLLATYIREALRWESSKIMGDPWLFSEEERQFYNFFFALIGLIWAQSTCISIWLMGTSRSLTFHRFRNHRRDILNNFQNITNIFSLS